DVGRNPNGGILRCFSPRRFWSILLADIRAWCRYGNSRRPFPPWGGSTFLSAVPARPKPASGARPQGRFSRIDGGLLDGVKSAHRPTSQRRQRAAPRCSPLLWTFDVPWVYFH